MFTLRMADSKRRLNTRVGMLFVVCVLLNILCPTNTNTGVKLVDADAHISDDPETTTAFHA